MDEKNTRSITMKTLEEPTTYTVKGNVFIVEPTFHPQGTETLGDVLVRLMKSDITQL